MPFAEKAKPLWDKGNLTQKQLAELTGVSESMISRYLSGATVPKEDIAQKILDALTAALPASVPETEHTSMIQDAGIRTALNLIRDTYEGRISDLKNDLIMEKREKWIFVCLLILTVGFVFALLFVDVSNGVVGWFRY